MKNAVPGRPSVPPRPAVPGAADDGMRPVMGWGLFTGGILIWGGIVFLWFLSTLGVKDLRPFSQLAQIYGLARWPSVAEFAVAMFGHAWNLAVAAAVALGATGWGLSALRLVRVAWPARGLREVLAGGAGFAILGLAMLGGGLAGLWFPGLPVVLVASGLAMLVPRRSSLRNLVPPRGATPGGVAMQVVAIAGAAIILSVALVPEVFYDSLVYHLSDPFNWAKVHKVTALPWNFFSNFPFTFEMLFGIGVLWGSDAVARLATAAISLLAAGLLGIMAAWLAGGSSLAGWAAAGIYLTTPLIANSAWMTGIDAGLVLYEAAAVFAFALWWTGRRPVVARLAGESHWLVVSAAFAGLGMGAKYTVGFTGAILGLGVILRIVAPDSRSALRILLAVVVVGIIPVTLSNVDEIRKASWAPLLARPLLGAYAVAVLAVAVRAASRVGWARWRAAAAGAFLYAGVAFVFVSPWNAKAWLFTRCPTYPFAYQAFDSFHTSPPRMDYQMGEFREFRWRPAKEWVLHPWFVTKISGMSNNSACGGLFLALLPMLLVFRGVDPRIRLIGVILLGRYLMWANVSNIVRYFAPGLALLGVLFGAWLGDLSVRRKSAHMAGVLFAAAFSFVNIVAILLVAQWSVSWFAIAVGAEKPRDFLLRERASYPAPPYAAGEAMNAILPPRAGVLYVGDARGAFWRGRLVAATVFDIPVLVEICDASRTEADVNRKLRQLGLTHVYFNHGEAQRTAGYRLFDWTTPRARALFEKWWATRLRLLWKAGWHQVFEIERAPVAVRTAALEFVHAPFDEFDELQKLDRAASFGMQQGRLADANATAREVVLRAPAVARAHELLAQTLAYLNQDRQALEGFRRATALGLISSQVHFNTGVVLRALGRPAEAAKEFAEANEVDVRWSKLK